MYWNRPDATVETWRGGWFHTGDLGYRDANGYLHIVDRRNDQIVTGGENVYPREVEAALIEHAGVVDVAVIGTPDDTWGQVVTAVLAGTSVTDLELEAWLAGRIARYKIPRRWIRMDELPRNATGKVLKGELRTRWATEGTG
jgi:fatty-acyl-CoA synthase